MTTLIAITVAAVLAQTPPVTRLSETQVATPATSFTLIRVLTPAGWIYVQPDPTIQIDTAASPPIIRAVLPPGATEAVQKFVVTIAAQTFTLTGALAPNTLPAVYRNGVLMAEDIDYALAWPILTFFPEQAIALRDIIQVRYKKP